MVSLFCCWPAAEGNAKGLLSRCGSEAWQHSDQAWHWPTPAAAAVTFFLASISSALRSWIFSQPYRASWEMLQLPSRTSIWISRGAGVEGRGGWGPSWCQWDSKWGCLTGSCLRVSFCHLGSVPALAVKLLMNSITLLFLINHKMSQPLLESIVYRNAEQDSGT